MYKKGAVEIPTKALIGLIVGISFLLILFALLLKFGHLLKTEECDNYQEFKNLALALKNKNPQVPFKNLDYTISGGDCQLVAFSKSPSYITKIELPTEVETSKICLCEVDNNQCITKENYCYKLKDIEDIVNINNQQFTTTDYAEGIIFLNFDWLNNKLIISIEKVSEKEIPCKNNIKFEIFPIENPVISSCFGWRDLKEKKDWHNGMDFSAPENTEVKAVADGVVYDICDKWHGQCECSIFNNKACLNNCNNLCGNYGNTIVIKHENEVYTRYSHLSSILTSIKGQQVKKGTIIGYSGNTGYSEGPHLDFKVYSSSDFSEKPDNYENEPLCYLPEINQYNLKTSALSCKSSPTIAKLEEGGSQLAYV